MLGVWGLEDLVEFGCSYEGVECLASRVWGSGRFDLGNEI